ncbi:hypothetical protein JXB11_03920 [Candidatus Woesearchaeota archaeon]|nr:hypothetical protein [Candidatus Woesearchaeota archaeon]
MAEMADVMKKAEGLLSTRPVISLRVIDGYAKTRQDTPDEANVDRTYAFPCTPLNPLTVQTYNEDNVPKPTKEKIVGRGIEALLSEIDENHKEWGAFMASEIPNDAMIDDNVLRLSRKYGFPAQVKMRLRDDLHSGRIPLGQDTLIIYRKQPFNS